LLSSFGVGGLIAAESRCESLLLLFVGCGIELSCHLIDTGVVLLWVELLEEGGELRHRGRKLGGWGGEEEELGRWRENENEMKSKGDFS
jgi:hypothetical protein